MAVNVNNGTSLGSIVVLPLKGEKGDGVIEVQAEIEAVQSELQSLIGTIGGGLQNEIDVANNRIDQLVAPTGEAPSQAEILDARVGANGVTYDTLGDAIRDQASDLTSDLAKVSTEILNTTGDVVPINVELGSLNTNTGAESARYDGSYLRTGFIPAISGLRYSLKLKNASTTSTVAIHALFYDALKNFISPSSYIGTAQTEDTIIKNITIPSGASFVRFRFGGTGLTVAEETFTMTLYDYGGVPVYKGAITTVGLDLNDFVTPSIWQLNDFVNYKPDNYPVDANGKIIVLSNNNPLTTVTTFQLVYTYRAGTYYRSSGAEGNWSDWTRLADVANTLYNFGNITTEGLDLNSGDFVHAGIWSVNDPTYIPKNCPTTNRCRIISFASSTNNSIYTYQIVIDADNDNIYERFSYTTSKWTQWTHRKAFHRDKAFECIFTASNAFVNNYDISQDSGETGRVSRLYALYDAVSDPDVTVTKDLLGKDASNTFNIFNYKVSLNTGDKPVVLLIVGEHGNELNSAMLGYYAYREIVTGVLKKYLNFVDFWVVPLMNPYGYENSLRNNANDVNLNRDFPAEWTYSTSDHNKTGDYSLSQPETNMIYNLLVNNKDKLLFICNKHDTGSIAKKLDTDQPDKVAYVSTFCESDSVVDRGISSYQNNQVRVTDSWIVNDCDIDISSLDLIVTRNVKTAGSLDLFANSIGIHGSLLEVCGSAYYSSDANHHYPATHKNDLARLGLDFFVNYISQTIEHNSDILDKDDLIELVKYYTRTLVDGSYVVTELYWDGSTLKPI